VPYYGKRCQKVGTWCMEAYNISWTLFQAVHRLCQIKSSQYNKRGFILFLSKKFNLNTFHLNQGWGIIVAGEFIKGISL